MGKQETRRVSKSILDGHIEQITQLRTRIAELEAKGLKLVEMSQALRESYKEIRVERDRYRDALEKIMKHQEITGAPMGVISTTYHIASTAIKEENDGA
jgi:ribosomal 50S subunit-associated protein YjgA (DUF615 family)